MIVRILLIFVIELLFVATYARAAIDVKENSIFAQDYACEVSYYMNEDTTLVKDQTNNNRDAEAVGVVFSDDHYVFNSAGDSITISGYLGVTGTAERTIYFELSTTSTTDQDLVHYGYYDSGDITAHGSRMNIRIDQAAGSSVYQIRVEADSPTWIRWTPQINDGERHKVALVFPEDGALEDIKCYVDGSLAAVDDEGFAATSFYDTASDREVVLGQAMVKDTFIGNFYEFAMFSRALSDYEAETLTSGGLRGTKDGVTTYGFNDKWVDYTPKSEKLDEWDITDASAWYTVTSDKVAWTNITRAANAWITTDRHEYKNFTIYSELEVTASTGSSASCPVLIVSNTPGTLQDNISASDGILIIPYFSGTDFRIQLRSYEDGTVDDYLGAVINTIYYMTLKRTSEDIRLEIYTDKERKTLADTLVIDYYATAYSDLSIGSKDSSGTDISTGYWQNISYENNPIEDVKSGEVELISFSTTDYTQDPDCLSAYLLDGNSYDQTQRYDGEIVNATQAVGQFRGAYDFNGTDAYISCEDLDITGTAFSLTAWVYCDTSPGTNAQFFIVNKGGGAQRNYYLSVGNYVADDTKIIGGFYNGGYDEDISTDNIPLQTWTHIAVTYDGTKIQVYIDGIANGSGTAKTDNLLADSWHMRIGARSDGNEPTDGKIDEVGVFQRALSAEEVLDIKNHGLKGQYR